MDSVPSGVPRAITRPAKPWGSVAGVLHDANRDRSKRRDAHRAPPALNPAPPNHGAVWRGSCTMPTEIDQSDETPTARARALARAGRSQEAEAIIATLIAAEFGRAVRSVAINADAYSLNSLNGF